MLAGRNDVEFPARFSKQITQYSDDGEILHGAYGYRWRNFFTFDQIDAIITALQSNPDCRRQVLEMWYAPADLGANGKDIPCNLVATFQILHGRLNMTVFNRSNDIIWGMLGANAVHFSMLQEYIASSIPVSVGSYWQISANAHVYRNDLYERCRPISDNGPEPLRRTRWDPYQDWAFLDLRPLFNGNSKAEWDQDLERFMEGQREGMETEFFRHVAVPMYLTWETHKENPEAAFDFADQIGAADWRKACKEWLKRRKFWTQKQS